VASKPSRPARTLLIFGIVLAAMFAGVALNGTWMPSLGLDLQGGTRITLSARTATSSGGVTTEKMNEAVDIIRARVNGTGVAEAEVTTQGGNNLIVEIPGEQRNDLVELVGQTAQLRFRIVSQGPELGRPQPTPTPGTPSPSGASPSGPTAGSPTPGSPTPGSPSPGSPTPNGPTPSGATPSVGPGSPTSSSTPSRSGARPAVRLPAGSAATASPTPSPTTGSPSATTSASPTPTPTTSASPSPAQTTAAPPTPSPSGQPTTAPITDPLNWQPDAAWQARFAAFTCPRAGARPDTKDISGQPLLACDEDGFKYLLSPAVIEGTQIDDASAGIPQNQATWVVNIEFDNSATDTFATVTQQLVNTPRQFAIVLDAVVLSAPGVNSPILNGQAEISGNFTQESAQALAASLKYGALPLSFRTESVSEEGPQLAADQLRAGILAGAFGLFLVVIYCLAYYRGLGLVVIASLIVAAATTYASVLLLGSWIGFTLSLPGIAGLIVAIGITADSFIVYFERLRDEVRDGKTLRSAVEAGWARAKMTILAADAVSILAALVLFIFAIGVVKGFAFALGLTTLIDVFVVFFFTKPLVTLLARTQFFGQGHPMSGLDPQHLGVSRLPSVRARRRPVPGSA